MKKLTSVAFILTVAVLMLFTVSCNSSSSSSNTDTAAPTEHEGEILTPMEGSTVYVRMDSLLNQYDMFLDLRAEFEEKFKKAQDDLDTKGRAFQRDANDFQDKYSKGLLTRSESQTKMEELSRREQQLLEQRQKVAMELDDEQNVMLNRVSKSIEDYVKVYNQEKNYSLIINTSGSNPALLWGNPGLDITNDLVKGLNEAYAKSLREPANPSTTE
ncbi:MAG: OmpH family outer membrane protein [Prevotellaceae bacterium]|jgi:outer membrane protein|nr:OmpH family outer membrane protein [Prevotellaceae bacterium]